jgi:hypothetical protein
VRAGCLLEEPSGANGGVLVGQVQERAGPPHPDFRQVRIERRGPLVRGRRLFPPLVPLVQIRQRDEQPRVQLGSGLEGPRRLVDPSSRRLRVREENPRFGQRFEFGQPFQHGDRVVDASDADVEAGEGDLERRIEVDTVRPPRALEMDDGLLEQGGRCRVGLGRRREQLAEQPVGFAVGWVERQRRPRFPHGLVGLTLPHVQPGNLGANLGRSGVEPSGLPVLDQRALELALRLVVAPQQEVVVRVGR